MTFSTATAIAHPNIAFIKYWGNRDNELRIPSNGSISMNLEGLSTRTTVSFQPSLPFDELIINGQEISPGYSELNDPVEQIPRSYYRSQEAARIGFSSPCHQMKDYSNVSCRFRAIFP